MGNLRWKWIGYHIYSNLLTVVFILLYVFFSVFVTEDINLSLDYLSRLVFFSLVSSSILGLLCGFSFSKNIRNRLQEVTVGVKNLAFGNLRYRLPFIQDKETGEIALAFNEMANRLEQQVVALQKLAEENEQLVIKTKAAAITEERQRLARDLHDAVSQQLFAISMTAATASRVITKNPLKCETLIANIEEASAKAQAEMRALLLQLRPVTLENERLVDAIASLAKELQTKQTIHCELELDEVSLPQNMENQLYRVIQEGLSNVLRHAHADKVVIKLSTQENKRVRLCIEDNGKGFADSNIAKTSMGLKGIRERIEQLGGTVEWLSSPGQGTRLDVRIPLTQ